MINLFIYHHSVRGPVMAVEGERRWFAGTWQLVRSSLTLCPAFIGPNPPSTSPATRSPALLPAANTISRLSLPTDKVSAVVKLLKNR